MFALSDIKEYWVLVSINETQDDIRIIKQSDDFKSNDDFEIDTFKLEYSNVIWNVTEENKPGIYKLVLEPVYTDLEDLEEGDEPEFDHMKVLSHELIFEI